MTVTTTDRVPWIYVRRGARWSHVWLSGRPERLCEVDRVLPALAEVDLMPDARSVLADCLCRTRNPLLAYNRRLSDVELDMVEKAVRLARMPMA